MLGKFVAVLSAIAGTGAFSCCSEIPSQDYSRRSVLIRTPSALFYPLVASASASPPQVITLPLKFTGNEYLVYFRVDGSLFRAVLDTGSPFLMIPGSCSENTKANSGCYQHQGVPSGLSNTYERFDGFEGDVEWRRAPFVFVNATGSMMTSAPLVTFGVASESIMSGGVFFGLIRDTEGWIRPSFLSQTPTESFEIDLISNQLTLSSIPRIRSDYIVLTNNLRRLYGDPVSHYAARAECLQVNGQSIGKDRTIYVIFDTGVTGMVMSRDLFNERYAIARERREKNLWGTVSIGFRSANGKLVELSSSKPLTTIVDPKMTWKHFQGHLIVMGLSFLKDRILTVDISQGKVWIQDNTTSIF